MKELDEIEARAKAVREKRKTGGIDGALADGYVMVVVDVPRLVAALRHALDFAGDDAIGRTLAAEVATILRGESE